MSSSTGTSTADRQRLRAARGAGGKNAAASRLPSPPRQRRPAMAALALVLIVGGALVAGLLAIRMDSRVEVLVASTDIAPGSEITSQNTTTVPIAYDDLNVFPESIADEAFGLYAKTPIRQGMLLDGYMLAQEDPIGDDRAIVSVVLSPALAPEKELQAGDLVEVVRASGSSAGGETAVRITQGLVLSINAPKEKDGGLGSGAASSANLIVPASTAADVIDASSANLAGLALVSRGTTDDVTLSGF
ncbi:MAG: SAF domain-containing protein [Nocardioides sp.]